MTVCAGDAGRLAAWPPAVPPGDALAVPGCRAVAAGLAQTWGRRGGRWRRRGRGTAPGQGEQAGQGREKAQPHAGGTAHHTLLAGPAGACGMTACPGTTELWPIR